MTTQIKKEHFLNLSFPMSPLNIKLVGEDIYVFDEWRSNYYVLTPEEWVRQHTLKYLVGELNYPSNRIALEQTLKYKGMHKRFDAVVYSKSLQSVMLIEFKKATSRLNNKSQMQLASYKEFINTKAYLLTNGLEWRCWIESDNSFTLHHNPPNYNDLLRLYE